MTPAQAAEALVILSRWIGGGGVAFVRLFGSLARTEDAHECSEDPLVAGGQAGAAVPGFGAPGSPSLFLRGGGGALPCMQLCWGTCRSHRGRLFSQMGLERQSLPGEALLFAFQFQAFYLDLLLLS